MTDLKSRLRSTNLVYDGSIPFRRADDPVSLLTEYSRQNAEGDRDLVAVSGTVAPELSVYRWGRKLATQCIRWIGGR